jgi:DNA-binding transcriptional LysR family regulator
MAFHLLPQIVLRYSQQFPHNRVRILDATGPEVTDAVVNKRADFGINVLAGSSEALETTPLLRDPFVLMCRDDHRLSRHEQVRWSDLQEEALILLSRSTGNGLILESALSELKLDLPRLYEVQHPSTALGLVALGAGAAVLPSLIILRDAYPRIRAIPLTGPAIRREIGLIRPREGRLSPAAQTLYSMVQEGFLAWTGSGVRDSSGPRKSRKAGAKNAAVRV